MPNASTIEHHLTVQSPTSDSSRRDRFLRTRRGSVLLVLFSIGLGATGCDDGIPRSRARDSIPPEVFVEAMVDLRQEALSNSSGQLAPEEADLVLERHELTADDLRHFTVTHGRNVPMMTAVWDEVARRVNEEITSDPDAETETL